MYIQYHKHDFLPGVATSSEVTTESDTTAEPDLVSFCAALGNSRALRVPALFKQG